jgi:hypothetical protein
MAEIPKMPAPETDHEEAPRRDIPEAAKRALAEAEVRRRTRDDAAKTEAARQEVGGRNGPDPVRYGDWEKDGIISDF